MQATLAISGALLRIAYFQVYYLHIHQGSSGPAVLPGSTDFVIAAKHLPCVFAYKRITPRGAKGLTLLPCEGDLRNSKRGVKAVEVPCQVLALGEVTWEEKFALTFPSVLRQIIFKFIRKLPAVGMLLYPAG